jgi:hypothetical protein
MFAFGCTIEEVSSACNHADTPNIVPAAILIAVLKADKPQDRLTAGQTVQHAFFDPARDSSAVKTAGLATCGLSIGDKCSQVPVKQEMGISCTSGHFLCVSCLESVMQDAFKPGNDSPGAVRSRMSDGRIHCQECFSAYSDAQVVKVLPLHLGEEYLCKRWEFVETQYRAECKSERAECESERAECESERAECESGMGKKIKQEIKQLKAMNDVQHVVLEARKHIENELLQAHCPSCKMAFYDFDGCFVLKCAT